MSIVKGGIGRLVATVLYFIIFCCSIFIVGATAWFIDDFYTNRDDWAVEGIAALTALYSLVATVLTCCLVGVGAFALVGIVLDVCFMAGMIAITALREEGRFGCPERREGQITSCELYVGSFALSLVAIFAFAANIIISALFLGRHRREKRTTRSIAVQGAETN